MKKRILPVILLAVMLLAGCGSEQEEINTLEDIKDMTLAIGAPEDIDANEYILKACPNAKIVPQSELIGIYSLAESKFDAYVAGRNYFEKAMMDGEIQGIKILDEPLVSYPCALGLSKLCKIPDFENTVNETMNRFISDGTLDDMQERWFLQGNEQMPEIGLDENAEYILNVVTYGESKPFSFFKDGKLTGFDVELAYRVCEANHWGMKLTNAQYPSMLMGLSTGKYDMISADLYVTENHEDNVVFSVPYRTQDICMAVRDTVEPKKQKEIKSIADMKKMKLIIGASDDADTQEFILEACPKAELVSQNDTLLGVRSVAEGKLDAYVVGRPYIERTIRESDIKGVKILDEPLHTYQCGLGLSKTCPIPNYKKSVDETVERLISDGTIEEMRVRWFEQEKDQMPEIKLDENPTYTLNAVTFGESKPFSFFFNGELSGFDVELVYRICEANHWGLNLTNAQYPAMLMGLSTGKYDMLSANLYITADRGENVDFSVPYKFDEIGVAVRDDSEPLSDKDAAQKPEYNTLSELANAKDFAIQTGTVFDQLVKEKYPQAKIEYYQEAIDCALAVASGKADAFVFDAPALEYIAACNDGVTLMPEYLEKDDYHFIMPKSERGEKLQKEFNEWLSEQRRNGEADRLYAFWCSNEEPTDVLDFKTLPETDGKIKIAFSPAGRPDVYYFRNCPAGYPVELIYNFCRDRGYGADVSVVSFDSLLPALASGKADIGATFISYTEERAESVLFTDTVKESGIGVLVRTVGSENEETFFDTLKNGLRKTFVAEERWKLIVSGLGVTALITLGGFLLANILGAAFCCCIMSRRKGLRIFADVYDRIMQGTPMVVILMLLYYVIFGKSNISGVWVAIIAFGLNSGASLAQQFCGAITGVDKGQTEAALAIGFTKYQAFTGIVFPQAARIVLPGYFSTLIGLMKGTSIVGYITVIDLTKSGDLIRSSTYDAFFPLLSIAVIYFLISFGLLSLLKCLRKKLEPKRVTAQEEAK
ncbi:MAG: ABC transporter permease subunit [Eubacteriales bacterium]|nr:ABC transporter permease subunit [Eubacteriales bacterium]